MLVSAVVQVCVRDPAGGVHHAGPELGRGHRAPPPPVRLDPVLPHAGRLLQRQSQGLPYHARLHQTDQLAGGGRAPPLLSSVSLCGGAGGGERAALGDGPVRGGGGGDDGKQSARLSHQNNLGQQECREQRLPFLATGSSLGEALLAHRGGGGQCFPRQVNLHRLEVRTGAGHLRQVRPTELHTYLDFCTALQVQHS